MPKNKQTFPTIFYIPHHLHDLTNSSVYTELQKYAVTKTNDLSNQELNNHDLTSTGSSIMNRKIQSIRTRNSTYFTRKENLEQISPKAVSTTFYIPFSSFKKLLSFLFIIDNSLFIQTISTLFGMNLNSINQFFIHRSKYASYFIRRFKHNFD